MLPYSAQISGFQFVCLSILLMSILLIRILDSLNSIESSSDFMEINFCYVITELITAINNMCLYSIAGFRIVFI